MTEEGKLPIFFWRIGLLERLIYGKDGAAMGAVVRAFKVVPYSKY